MIDEATDFYEVLGITAEEKKLTGDAFRALLKKKYRLLVLKYHPDKHVDESEEERKKAEEMFKRIQKAYKVLSDDMERMKYDYFPSGYHSSSGTSSTVVRPQRVMGATKRLSVVISLAELYKGGSKTVAYTVMRKCSHCGGKGGEEVTVCPHCNGTGKYVEEIRNGFAYSRVETLCPYCNGNGRKVTNPCSCCNGTGLEKGEDTITIPIPDLDQLVDRQGLDIPQKGHDIPWGIDGVRGNLEVFYRYAEEQDSEWLIDSSNQYNLIRTIKVPLLYCLLGKKITMTHLDGSVISFTLKECTQNNTLLRLSGKGLSFNNGRHRGDLLVKVSVDMPEKLNKKERGLLAQLEGSDNFKRKK